MRSGHYPIVMMKPARVCTATARQTKYRDFTPDPQFRVTGLVCVFDGQVLFNANGGDISNAFIVVRKGVSAGGHSLQVMAHLEELGEIAGYKFVVPASHSVQTDGARACKCILAAEQRGHTPSATSADTADLQSCCAQ